MRGAVKVWMVNRSSLERFHCQPHTTGSPMGLSLLLEGVLFIRLHVGVLVLSLGATQAYYSSVTSCTH
jgi:hypothetical protein